MESNWNVWSKEAIGYSARHNEINEEYVAMYRIQKMIDKGTSPERIMLNWNAGGAKQCSKGVNSKGVKYDSCEYVQVTMNHYKNI